MNNKIQEAITDKDWGWFSPNEYKLYSFNEFKKTSRISKLIKTHHNFISTILKGDINNAVVAIKNGWVRWFIDVKGTLHLHFRKSVTNRKKLLSSIIKNLDVEYSKVVIELQDDNMNDEEIFNMKASEFIKDFDSEKIFKKTNAIQEYVIHDTYLEWGLVSPSGKFYTSLDKEFEYYIKDYNIRFYHETMMNIITGKHIKIGNAIGKHGWIRWFIEDDETLFIDCNLDILMKRNKIENILTVAKNVSFDYRRIILDTPNTYDIFRNYSELKDFIVSEKQ